MKAYAWCVLLIWIATLAFGVSQRHGWGWAAVLFGYSIAVVLALAHVHRRAPRDFQ